MSEIDQASGVYKKIISQKDAFEKKGYDCKVIFLADSDSFRVLSNGTLRDYDFVKDIAFIESLANNSELDYFRFELLRHKRYSKMLSICKKSHAKIVLEIPTFPPYEESLARSRNYFKNGNFLSAFKTFIGSFLVRLDTYRFAKKVDMVILVADDFKFKNTKTIRIENGIDLKQNKYSFQTPSSVVRIIAVSNFAVWNGYDRAIKGLSEYIQTNKKKDISIVFVGDVNKASSLIKMVDELHLHDVVRFTGSLSGIELDEEYSKCDVAMAGLGNHRRKVFANSSLKVKEYAARGKIMILSDSEGIEEEIKQKSFVVPSNETPIDFSSFVRWYRSLKNVEQATLEISAYANKNYSWELQIEKIVKEIDYGSKL